MHRSFTASLALAALIAVPAFADIADVYCGSFTPIRFRATAYGKAPQARADQAMEVINKHLGGKAPAVVAKPDGKNFRLTVQRDLVAVVTPADAKAEKSKNVKSLALSWSKKLTSAFKESCAQK